MKNYLFFFIALTIASCSNGKTPIAGETEWQKKVISDFKDASKSPLTEDDLKNFKGLDFFSFDSTFVVSGKLKRTPDSEWFRMKTTTDRVSEERVYGIISFNLNGKEYKLNVYQGKENLATKGFEDYLFLPFLDNTNGESTYGGGRYIDLKIPNGDIIIVDFNKAFNPYCVYNEGYSCPIVPRQNYLNTKIEAGLKMYESD